MNERDLCNRSRNFFFMKQEGNNKDKKMQYPVIQIWLKQNKSRIKTKITQIAEARYMVASQQRNPYRCSKELSMVTLHKDTTQKISFLSSQYNFKFLCMRSFCLYDSYLNFFRLFSVFNGSRNTFLDATIISRRQLVEAKYQILLS